MLELWNSNYPRDFWQCQSATSDDIWQNAIGRALPLQGLPDAQPEIDTVLALALGEARFGSEHWTLSLPKKIYYLLKPVLPRFLTRLMRRGYYHTKKTGPEIQWPVDQRYVVFLWDVLAQVLREIPDQKVNIKALWPDDCRYSLVLTHDVETKLGVEYVRKVADLEEDLGFRSSFNFVPERYQLDLNLIDELRSRGFEIGIHGLKHDGKLFSSRKEFERRANKINRYLKKFDAVGFRTPLTHRNPEWMQALDLEYDLSFFDTDPFEPIPGGTMSIWPFFIGRFVELPYTLVQDYTLTSVLGETTPQIWLEKVDFIEKYFGMALLNSHPDYLAQAANWDVYRQFLLSMKEHNGYWQALPREVANWWRMRASTNAENTGVQIPLIQAALEGDTLQMTNLPI
jgi:peptidoglycan/xylan/chitin deacetylase (PgdA/CDA1 family)